MTDDIAISVRGLSKSYTIRHNAPKHSTLGEAIVDRIRRPFQHSTTETFWALKDVSFDVKKGEVVGIIGRNGAGKSTLLKILSRITSPTTGEVDLYGRVGSLLEVGTGFHAELTGRENIFLNGAILGMSRAEIRRQFDAIVDFAGVEQFLDTPVKRYSSGMYVRLAFAVAAHLRSEILIVDEVLAVGDAEFQKKCLDKMKEVSSSGRTVMFVSHNMNSLVELCGVAVMLRQGKVQDHGATRGLVQQYLREDAASGRVDLRDWVVDRRGDGRVKFTSVQTDAGDGHPASTFEPFEDLYIRCGLRGVPDAVCNVNVSVRNPHGVIVLHPHSSDAGQTLVLPGAAGEVVIRIPNLPLADGDYYITAYCEDEYRICADRVANCLGFRVASSLPFSSRSQSPFRVVADWQMEAV